MPKKDWGTKRTCPSCGARFYDLRRNPIDCPKCEFTFEPEAPSRPSRAAAEKAPEPVVEKTDKVPDELREQAGVDEKDGDDIDVDVDVADDDDDDDDEDGVLEDASDLGGEDDVPVVVEKASDDSG